MFRLGLIVSGIAVLLAVTPAAAQSWLPVRTHERTLQPLTRSAEPVAVRQESVVRQEKTGTAFFVDDSGDLLTARHAVDSCMRVVVAKEGHVASARVVALSGQFDVALIKIPATWGLAAVFPRGATATPNEMVFAAAYDTLPGMTGRGGLIANATVAPNNGGSETGHLAIDSPVTFGASGAPVLDGSGLVQGVISRRTMANRVLAVDAAETKAFLASNGIHFAQDDRPQLAGGGSRANRAASISARVTCLQN